MRNLSYPPTLLFAILAAQPAHGQVNQYYEQYRATGQVTGACENILAFSEQLRTIFQGSWSAQVEVHRLYVNRWEVYPVPSGLTVGDIAGRNFQHEAWSEELTFLIPDAFGGIRAQLRRSNARIIDAYPRANPPPQPHTTNGSFGIAMSLPIAQEGTQCVLRNPLMKYVTSSGAEEASIRIIDTETMVVDWAGIPITFKRTG